jgi:hypothetical protein
MQYWEVINNYSPTLWGTPTLAMLLRHIFRLDDMVIELSNYLGISVVDFLHKKELHG